MSVFDRIVDAGTVEDAATATLKAWSSAYLGELERQTGRDQGSLPDIRAWTAPEGDFRRWPEEQLPCLVLISPGLNGSPERHEGGRYSATWGLALAVVVSASTEAATDRLAKLYAAAMRACLVQRRLGGLAEMVTWVGEDYTIEPADRRRTIGAARVIFDVDIGDVTTADSGPAGDPPDEPREPLPDPTTVTDVDVTVEPKP